jgi:hypothetical protein
MDRRPIYATNSSLSDQLSPPLLSVVVDGTASGVIRPPIRTAYESETAYVEALKIGMMYASKYGLEYVNHYD